jgi:hypothetical protein
MKKKMFFGTALSLAALTAGALELPPAGTRDAKRPYEMVWAGRTADEYPSLLKLDSAEGWKCEGRDCAAALAAADEHLLFEDAVLRLTYRATGKNPQVDFSPAVPCEIKEPFDSVGVWVYGNNFYGKSPKGTPSTTLTGRFLDSAGKPFTVRLGHIHHREWCKFQRRLSPELRQRVARGAKFLGFTLTGGTNTEDRTLEFASLSCFTLVQKPLEFKPRPKRGVQIFKDAPQGANTGAGRLPFPNTERTVLPPETRPDKGIEFRFPKEPGVWDDLAFRVDGGEWRRLAIGGGVWPRSQAGKAKVRFWRDGDSVVADVVVKGGEVEELRFGGIDVPEDSEEVPLPFYSYGVYNDWQGRPAVVAAKVDGKAVFISATLDWTQSNASRAYPGTEDTSGYFAANGGARYLPKSDGRRNDVYERFVWTVSRRFDATLPTIPNDPSPWKHVTGKRGWIPEGANRNRQVNYDSNFRRHRMGMTEMVVNDHETGWRDGDESFTFRTEPAPKKGGDKGQYDYTRYMIDKLGYYYGPYNNYTDLAPVNAHWHSDNVMIGDDGDFRESWARCYAPKPLYGLAKCEELIPVIQRKFRFNTAYCDVHTAVIPWGRTDYDARVPGGGTFAQTFYAFGEIMLLQKKAWGGPVYSEGRNHWLYSGLTDGNYGQDRAYDLVKHPWLVDFNLLRMHPLTCDHMGYCSMFYGDNNVPKDRWEAMHLWFAAGLAFGHMPFPDSKYQTYAYYMAMAISSRYSQENVKAIRYADGRGRLLDTSEAVISKVYKRSQVAVAYDGGTLVTVNGSRDGEWMKVRRGKGALLLPPGGFFAAGGDVVVYSGPVGGNPRADFCASDGYVYLNGRGRYVECPGGAAAGEFVRLRGKDGTEEVIAFSMKSGDELVLPYRAEKITGLDYKDRKETGAVDFTVDERGRTHFKLKAGSFSYRVIPAVGTVFASPADYEAAVLAEKNAAIPAPPPKAPVLSRPLPRQCKSGIVSDDWKFSEIDRKSGAVSVVSSRQCGNVSKRGIITHPPYKNGVTGSVYSRFRISLAPDECRFTASVGKGDSSTPGDGIFYKVAVKAAGEPIPKVVSELNVTKHGWCTIEADLSPWAGKPIELYLIAAPGANTYGDAGCWADAVISRSIKD